MSYRHMRWVYQTPIPMFLKDALPKAVEQAIERAAKWQPATELGYAFRIDEASYSVAVDPDADEYETRTQLEIVAFPILKKTENGYRIRLGGWDDNPETTWISHSWTKRWAALTAEDALRDYIARRKRQASIYERRAKKARDLAGQAERLLEPQGEPA